MVVLSPGEKQSLVVLVEGSTATTENIDCLLGANLLNLARLVVLVSGSRHTADFATLSVTPCPDLAICSHCHTVIKARHNLDEPALALVERRVSKLSRCLDSISDLALDGVSVQAAEICL